MMTKLKVLFLVAMLAVFGVACGDGDDDDAETTGDTSPTLTDEAGSDGTADADTTGNEPGPVGSPNASPATTGDDFDTGGGAIYDESPSVEPPAG